MKYSTIISSNRWISINIRHIFIIKLKNDNAMNKKGCN